MCVPEAYWINPEESEFQIIIEKFVNDTFFTGEKLPIFLGGGGQPADSVSVMFEDKQIRQVKECGATFFKLESTKNLLLPKTFPYKATLKIDLSLRMAYSRAHTCQHIVSAIMKNHWGITTEKAILNADEAKLYYSGKISLEQIKQIYQTMNKIIQGYHNVNSHIVPQGTNIDLEGRIIDFSKIRGTIPTDEQCIRIVEVEGIDLNTCGGTHLKVTNEIIAIAFTEVKTGVLTFFTGQKALDFIFDSQTSLLELSQIQSLPVDQALMKTKEKVQGYPNLEKINFNLNKTLLVSVLDSIIKSYMLFRSENFNKKFFIELGTFSKEPLIKNNFPVKAWNYKNGIIMVCEFSFGNKSAFVSALSDITLPIVIIATLDNDTIICQSTNTKFYSAKDFLDLFSKYTGTKGGGNEKQIQCSVRNIKDPLSSVFEVLKSVGLYINN